MTNIKLGNFVKLGILLTCVSCSFLVLTVTFWPGCDCHSCRASTRRGTITEEELLDRHMRLREDKLEEQRAEPEKDDKHFTDPYTSHQKFHLVKQVLLQRKKINSGAIHGRSETGLFNEDVGHERLRSHPDLEVPDAVAKSKGQLTSCPELRQLFGPLRLPKGDESDLEEADAMVQDFIPGGRYTPPHCQALSRVAIVIPFRNREVQLKTLMGFLHPILRRQQIDYGVYVVEQTDELTFNKGMLYNLAYLEALKDYDWDCFIFHDVDLLPEDDRNLYTCPEEVKHMSVAVSTLHYELPYNNLVGGVLAVNTDAFRKINGYSNLFWGWGGEDDDFYLRLTNAGFKVQRGDPKIARYTMLDHKLERPSNYRVQRLTQGKKYYDTDGLCNIRYDIKLKSKERLYTKIRASLEKVYPENYVNLETVPDEQQTEPPYGLWDSIMKPGWSNKTPMR